MVVNRHRKHFFGMLLPDHVLIEEFLYFRRRRQFFHGAAGAFFAAVFFFHFVHLVMDDADADIDAFVTDVNAASGYQLFDFRLRFSAEGAADLVVFMSVVFTHLFSPFYLAISLREVTI